MSDDERVWIAYDDGMKFALKIVEERMNDILKDKHECDWTTTECMDWHIIVINSVKEK